MPALKPPIGLILSGGLSIRMRQDKGLAPLGDERYADRAIRLLRPYTTDIHLSIRADQNPAYSAISGIKLIPDENISSGPLRGILSAHRKYPDANFLVLAVDMIYLKNEHIERLTTALGGGTSVCFSHESGIYEPLVAGYLATDLETIDAWSSIEPDAGLSSWLKKISIQTIPIPAGEASCFTSQNEPLTR